jgi:hypothetical protein
MTVLSLHQSAAAAELPREPEPIILSAQTIGEVTRTTYQECSGIYTEYRTGETALIIRHGDNHHIIEAFGMFSPVDDLARLRELLTLLDCSELRAALR